MRSHMTRSSSSARQAGVIAQKQEYDMEVDGEDVAGEDEDDADRYVVLPGWFVLESGSFWEHIA